MSQSITVRSIAGPLAGLASVQASGHWWKAWFCPDQAVSTVGRQILANSLMTVWSLIKPWPYSNAATLRIPPKLSGPENNKAKKSSSLTGGPFSTSDVWRQFVTSLSEEEKSAFIYMQTKLTRAKRLLSRLVLANTGEWKEGAGEQTERVFFPFGKRLVRKRARLAQRKQPKGFLRQWESSVTQFWLFGDALAVRYMWVKILCPYTRKEIDNG